MRLNIFMLIKIVFRNFHLCTNLNVLCVWHKHMLHTPINATQYVCIFDENITAATWLSEHRHDAIAALYFSANRICLKKVQHTHTPKIRRVDAIGIGFIVLIRIYLPAKMFIHEVIQYPIDTFHPTVFLSHL